MNESENGMFSPVFSNININRRKNLIGNFGTYVDVQSFYRAAYKGEDFKDSNRLMGNSSSVFK